MSKRGMTPDEPVGTWHPSRTTVAIAPRWTPGSLAEEIVSADLPIWAKEDMADCVERLTRAARAALVKLDSLDGHGAPDEAEALRAAVEAAENWGKR